MYIYIYFDNPVLPERTPPAEIKSSVLLNCNNACIVKRTRYFKDDATSTLLELFIWNGQKNISHFINESQSYNKRVGSRDSRAHVALFLTMLVKALKENGWNALKNNFLK